jgi:hypothetical protein
MNNGAPSFRAEEEGPNPLVGVFKVVESDSEEEDSKSKKGKKEDKEKKSKKEDKERKGSSSKPASSSNAATTSKDKKPKKEKDVFDIDLGLDGDMDWLGDGPQVCASA